MKSKNVGENALISFILKSYFPLPWTCCTGFPGDLVPLWELSQKAADAAWAAVTSGLWTLSS